MKNSLTDYKIVDSGDPNSGVSLLKKVASYQEIDYAKTYMLNIPIYQYTIYLKIE